MAYFAISLGKTVAQISASFSPIPALSPAADILCGIIQLCENVTINRWDGPSPSTQVHCSHRVGGIGMQLVSCGIDATACCWRSETIWEKSQATA